MKEKRSIEVCVTVGDGVDIAGKRYIAGFASIIFVGKANILHMDFKYQSVIEARAGDVQ